MSETLCTLRGAGGGGGGKLVETVLWTNPSPTSAFSAQAVTLSETIDNYDYIKILFRKSTSDATSYNLMTDVSTWTTIYISGDTDRGFRLLGNTIVSSSTNYRACTCVNTDHTKVQIGNVSGGGGTSYIIPTAIIGIKNMGGIRTNEKYDILPFKSLPGNTAISFTTKGEAKAIWITCKAQSSGTDSMILTNVNPNTGEIDNNTIYRTRTASLNTFDINTGRSFTVTNGTISSSNLSSSAYYISCAYTY